jgi:hypothetical protein
MEYHSETLSDTIRKYPTYEKDMYSIVQSYRHWKHYILRKETIIHTNHKPLQFIQTKGKFQNDRHIKWSTYLQQFYINIKYKTWISNHIADYLSRPLVAALTTMLHSCGHATYEWPPLYQQDLNISTTYHLLGTGATVTYFHIQDGLLCHLGHLCVPRSKRANMIWESHYSQMAGHFVVEKTVSILQKHFYCPKL